MPETEDVTNEQLEAMAAKASSEPPEARIKIPGEIAAKVYELQQQTGLTPTAIVSLIIAEFEPAQHATLGKIIKKRAEFLDLADEALHDLNIPGIASTNAPSLISQRGGRRPDRIDYVKLRNITLKILAKGRLHSAELNGAMKASYGSEFSPTVFNRTIKELLNEGRICRPVHHHYELVKKKPATKKPAPKRSKKAKKARGRK